MTRVIKRGQIYMADLEPVIGSEQGGVRPVVVIQNNVGNRFSPTVIAAPVTARLKKNLPTHVKLTSPFLPRDSIVLMEQIRTIDKRRLIGYIGEVSEPEMKGIEKALCRSVGVREAE